MDKCFLVLLRYWACVHGISIRLWDTRWFHEVKFTFSGLMLGICVVCTHEYDAPCVWLCLTRYVIVLSSSEGIRCTAGVNLEKLIYWIVVVI